MFLALNPNTHEVWPQSWRASTCPMRVWMTAIVEDTGKKQRRLEPQKRKSLRVLVGPCGPVPGVHLSVRTSRCGSSLPKAISLSLWLAAVP